MTGSTYSFAKNTTVDTGKSQMQIEKLVKSEGASQFFRGDIGGKTVIGFSMKDRKIMFELPDVEGGRGSDQRERTRWRALLLAIKAKFVSVNAGVESFEEAFLPHIVVPTNDGKSTRFAAVALRAIAQSYGSGAPMTLPQLGSG